ncbi:MAG TPA: heat-inducible transcriptional repressor HrcA [bacterium]|nr:heat-inducible transcriptional repressor HrcA [bacterium]
MKARLEAQVMDARLRSVLLAIVENYIETVEPVGSRTLSKMLDLGLSSATIRNVMADLTEQGYLEQPHTSAGRVPTNRAYRFYVEQGGGEGLLPEEVKRVVERTLSESASGLMNLLSCTSRLLSELTQLTSVVASPRVSKTRLRLIEFLRISDHRIYAVLITQSNMVYHKIIEVSEDLAQDFLNSVSRYLNEQFARKPLEEMRQQVQDRLMDEKETYDQLLAHAVRLSKKALDLSDEREVYVEGLSSILREFGDLNRIRELLVLLEQKNALVERMDASLQPGGVHIAIGMENGHQGWNDCSLVTASYSYADNVLGAIGVIGPTRMNYRRVIPIVNYTARALSQAIMEQ